MTRAQAKLTPGLRLSTPEYRLFQKQTDILWQSNSTALRSRPDDR